MSKDQGPSKSREITFAYLFFKRWRREREMELWSQWGTLWEKQVVWFRQFEGMLKDFRRWTDSFLINEGALTPDPQNSLWVEGYSALPFDWKHESVTYELSVPFLLIGSGGKGQDGWRRGRKRWVAKNTGSWTWDFKGFAGLWGKVKSLQGEWCFSRADFSLLIIHQHVKK